MLWHMGLVYEPHTLLPTPLWNLPNQRVTASAMTMSPCPEKVGNMLGPDTCDRVGGRKSDWCDW